MHKLNEQTDKEEYTLHSPTENKVNEANGFYADVPDSVVAPVDCCCYMGLILKNGSLQSKLQISRLILFPHAE